MQAGVSRHKTEFSRNSILENTQLSDFTKINPVGAQLFHADRQTDITKLIVAFRNFCERVYQLSILSIRRIYALRVIIKEAVIISLINNSQIVFVTEIKYILNFYVRCR